MMYEFMPLEVLSMMVTISLLILTATFMTVPQQFNAIIVLYTPTFSNIFKDNTSNFTNKNFYVIIYMFSPKS